MTQAFGSEAPAHSWSLMLCGCRLETLNNSTFDYVLQGVCFLQQENGALGEARSLGSCVVLSWPLRLSSWQGLCHILSVPYKHGSASLSWYLPAYSSHLLPRAVKKLPRGLGVGEDSSCTISWMQAWGKSELVRKESALVPLVADSFGASWPFPLPLPLHPGVHHPVYPSTEAAVLQAAHPLWVGAKEVCKRGNWYPYRCVFILHQTTN